MTAITFDFSEDDVQALPDNLAQIPAAAPPVLPDAGPTVSEHGYLRAYANTEQNSRCVARLPAGTWRVEWHADLRPQFPPAFVLHDTGNILVLAGTWQLFSSTGQRIQMALGGAGMGALDPANRLFYMVSREGYIGAYDIATGKEHFAWLPVFGDEYNRVLIARRGQTVVSVGIERQLDPHRHHLANSAVVESLELPNPLRVDEMGLVSITDETRKLHLESSQCVAAMHEGMIACAVPGRLVLLDSNFKVHGALKAEFTPISLSMDEDWRLYLVVEKHSAENHSAESEKGAALWAVNERGERWLDLKLPRDFNPTRYPPIIGYDHRIVLLDEHHILAFKSDGAKLWEYTSKASLAGAIITPDHALIVTDGSEIAEFDASGHKRILYTSSDILRTPPVLTSTGRLLAATGGRLLSLTVQSTTPFVTEGACDGQYADILAYRPDASGRLTLPQEIGY